MRKVFKLKRRVYRFMGTPPTKNVRQSPYYWWIEYLRRVEGYGPRHPLYKDFGDITRDFKDWWHSTGKELFSEPDQSNVRFVTSLKGIDVWKPVAGQSRREAGDTLVIAVPLTLKTREIHQRVNEIVKWHQRLFYAETKPRRKGRKNYKNSKAKYPLYATPVISALEQTLMIYDLHKQKPELKHHEIALELRLAKKAEVHDPSSKVAYAAKNVANSKICRSLNWAKRYIENVGQGQFPKK